MQFKVGDKVHVEWIGKAMGDGIVRFAYPEDQGIVTVEIAGVLVACPTNAVTKLADPFAPDAGPQPTTVVVELKPVEIKPEEIAALVEELNKATAPAPEKAETEVIKKGKKA